MRPPPPALFRIVEGAAEALLSCLFLERLESQLLCFELGLTFLQLRSQFRWFLAPFFIGVVRDYIRVCTKPVVKSNAAGLNQHLLADSNATSGGIMGIEPLPQFCNISFQLTYLLFLRFDLGLE